MQCPKCNLPNPISNTHCSLCQTPLSSIAAGTATQVLSSMPPSTPQYTPTQAAHPAMTQPYQPPTAPTQVAQAATGSQRCLSCGQLQNSGAKFCLACGTNLLSGSPPAPAAPQMYPIPSQQQPSNYAQSNQSYNNYPSGGYQPTNVQVPIPFTQANASLSLAQRMVNLSIGMRIVGAMLVFLFFGPFVSCGNVDISGARISASAVLQSERGNRNEANVFWVLVVLVPLSGVILFLAGLRAGSEASRDLTTADPIRGSQVFLILGVIMLLAVFAVIKLNPGSGMFFDLEWGYYLSFVMLLTGFGLTMMWNNACKFARRRRIP